MLRAVRAGMGSAAIKSERGGRGAPRHGQSGAFRLFTPPLRSGGADQHRLTRRRRSDCRRSAAIAARTVRVAIADIILAAQTAGIPPSVRRAIADVILTD